MPATTIAGGRSRGLILTAMIFAVSMTFIDMTIISIAAPQIQRDLGLSATGVQWTVNAYLLALAALFAFGGRLADTLGHRTMVTLGVIVFAGASALCGLTPRGGVAAGWLVAFRAVQGAGGAIMYPAALGIVVQTFPLRHRGRALALFFGVAGALTALGPVAGGYLIEWTWRAIFWVNIPVGLVALVLIAGSRPDTAYWPAPVDYRGLALIVSGIGLSVFGFQQSSIWGWTNPAIGGCIAAGLVLLVTFDAVERKTGSPLIDVSIFGIRPFLVQNLVLWITLLAFVPVFFFSSQYAQISLGQSPLKASLVLLYFSAGFIAAAQIGGRMLDRVGAKGPVVAGCALAAAGLWLWAAAMTDLSFSSQVGYVILAGAGMGLMLGPANADAVNRASRLSYGEATGITQTVRNYAASLGIAVLGTILVTMLRSNVTSSLAALGAPGRQAAAQAARIAQFQGASSGTAAIPRFVRVDFAHASQAVFVIMGGIMAAAALVALFGLRAGRQEEPGAAETMPGSSAPHEQSAFRP
jgi:EmrB/QacA subfamily drug resistance transporter